jgi:hypothetical protein
LMCDRNVRVRERFVAVQIVLVTAKIGEFCARRENSLSGADVMNVPDMSGRNIIFGA